MSTHQSGLQLSADTRYHSQPAGRERKPVLTLSYTRMMALFLLLFVFTFTAACAKGSDVEADTALISADESAAPSSAQNVEAAPADIFPSESGADEDREAKLWTLVERVAADAVLIVEVNDNTNALVDWMVRAGDHEISSLILYDQLAEENLSEDLEFVYALFLPDLRAFDPCSLPNYSVDEEKINWLESQYEQAPETAAYIMTCFVEDDEILWLTDDLDDLIAELDQALAAYFAIAPQEPESSQAEKAAVPVQVQSEAASNEQSAAPARETPALKALDFPTTGELTVNNNSSYGVLRFKVAAGNPTYIKLYRTSGELVKTLFINGGETYTTSMPSGSFIAKYATGSTWYGEKEMFGNTGVYQKADTVLTFNFEGDGYEITLEQVVNGNLGSVAQARDNF